MNAAKPTYAILFDMDGVLVDTMPYHKRSFKHVCRRYGYSDADVREATQRSNSLKALHAELQARGSMPDTFPQFVDKVLEDLFITIEQAGGLSADPALLAFLKDIRAHGFGVAVGTSAVRKSAARKLALAELHHEFDVIVTADDVENHKPAPDVYLKAAAALGVDPHHCVVIDDDLRGITAGKQAGAKTIGFTQYITDKQALSAAADLTANSFAELNYDKIRELLSR